MNLKLQTNRRELNKFSPLKVLGKLINRLQSRNILKASNHTGLAAWQ